MLEAELQSGSGCNQENHAIPNQFDQSEFVEGLGWVGLNLARRVERTHRTNRAGQGFLSALA